MQKGKLLLLRKTRLQAALRVNAIHDCLDGDEDFGDHFASNANSPGQTSAGGGEFFLNKYFRLTGCKTSLRLDYSNSINGAIFFRVTGPIFGTRARSARFAYGRFFLMFSAITSPIPGKL